jgi:hypothetical protein
MLKKATLNADGAKEEHSIIKTKDKPNSNVVVIKMESHSSSPAQEHSRQKIAKDTTATGATTLANSQRKDNSQMRKPVMIPVNHKSIRNAILQLRNVKTAQLDNQDVILMLIARLSAMQLWPNATIQLDNAKNVTQEQTKIAT